MQGEVTDKRKWEECFLCQKHKKDESPSNPALSVKLKGDETKLRDCLRRIAGNAIELAKKKKLHTDIRIDDLVEKYGGEFDGSGDAKGLELVFHIWLSQGGFVWGSAMNKEHDPPSPEGWGWKEAHGSILVPVYTTLPPMSEKKRCLECL